MIGRPRVSSLPQAELPMTPMIDIVFLLLIFFVLTVSPTEVVAHLGAQRDIERVNTARLSVPLIRIEVLEQGFVINGVNVNEAALSEHLVRQARLDPGQAVCVFCDGRARHESFIAALNDCAKAGFANLSVISRE